MITGEQARKAADGAARAPRRDRRRSRNHERLTRAAVDLLLNEGIEHVTPTRVAAAAGLHKPAFYAHFDDVDACLEAIAIDVLASDIMKSLTARADELPPPTEEELRGGPPPPEVVEGLIDAIHQELKTAKAHERVYRLTWRVRDTDGPLGEAVRQLDRLVLEHWVDYYWRLAMRYTLDARHLREVSELADHSVGVTYRAISRVLEGRVVDLRAEAERVYRYLNGLIVLEFRRMLGASPP